ncbi:MAG: hypothetical protein MJ154_03435 [Candidatus Saccharibacteria bacterium]|nr:hypothetical protein [Candidatus Saccharibacteria bacterium]
MFSVKKYLKIKQARKRAEFVAIVLGRTAENCERHYSDNKMRIFVTQYTVKVYYLDRFGGLKIRFQCDSDSSNNYYTYGEWEKHLAMLYKKAKKRP